MRCGAVVDTGPIATFVSERHVLSHGAYATNTCSREMAEKELTKLTHDMQLLWDEESHTSRL